MLFKIFTVSIIVLFVFYNLSKKEHFSEKNDKISNISSILDNIVNGVNDIVKEDDITIDYDIPFNTLSEDDLETLETVLNEVNDSSLKKTLQNYKNKLSKLKNLLESRKDLDVNFRLKTVNNYNALLKEYRTFLNELKENFFKNVISFNIDSEKDYYSYIYIFVILNILNEQQENNIIEKIKIDKKLLRNEIEVLEKIEDKNEDELEKLVNLKNELSRAKLSELLITRNRLKLPDVLSEDSTIKKRDINDPCIKLNGTQRKLTMEQVNIQQNVDFNTIVKNTELKLNKENRKSLDKINEKYNLYEEIDKNKIEKNKLITKCKISEYAFNDKLDINLTKHPTKWYGLEIEPRITNYLPFNASVL